jgi:response regulator RpfG family c-di-GMP phosphodiesterase
MPKPLIILLDDDKTMLNSLMDQLRAKFRSHYSIEAVQTIQEAKDLLELVTSQGSTISLIISDWLLPPDRTNDFLGYVHIKYPSIKLMLLSGYADADSVRELQNTAGILEAMRKPWQEEDLLQKVKGVLEPAL